MNIDIDIPEVFTDLLQTQSRYKVYYGGRGGGKSHSIAQSLIIKSLQSKVRILCTREIQRSIADSVHRLLSDMIFKLKLDDYFVIEKASIKCRTGSEFIFAGLYSHINELKSLEGINICWIEEAEKVSEYSYDILIPTIRQPDSEIWISFNPALRTDSTYRRFILHPPSESIIIKTTWEDNPWFPDVLKREMLECKNMYPDKYRHIWLGEPIENYKARVYNFNRTQNLTRKLMKYSEGFETCVSFDFGVQDDTAIIFYQIIQVTPTDENPRGVIIHVFDEYINNNKQAEHYRDIVEQKGYKIDRYFCDPSGSSRDSSLKSWVDKLSYNPSIDEKDWHFEYTHKYSIAEMVDCANMYLPYIRINEQICPKTTAMFESWKYRTDKDGEVVLPPRPEHDTFSHLGTSFYYFTTNYFMKKRSGGGVFIH